MVECPKDYKISRLIAKKLMGVILPEDEEKLNAWLEEDAKNKDLYRRILEVENFSARDMYAKRLDVEHTWDALKEQLAGQRKRRSLFSSWQIGVAASVILLVGIGLYWGFNKRPKVKQVEMVAHVEMGGAKAILVTSRGDEIVLQDSSVQLITLGGGMVAKNDGSQVSYKENEGTGKDDVLEYNTIRVPRGGEYIVRLEDGTTVYLNSESELRIPVHFGKGERLVWLTGEAYFSVKHEAERKFVVRTNKADIAVLGTEFGVRVYSEEDELLTTLVKGSVEVKSDHDVHRIIPGEQATVDNTGKIEVREVNVDEFVAWKSGRVVFVNARLEDIMDELQRWYDFNVFYSSPELKELRFTMDIMKYKEVSEIFELMEKIKKVSFSVNGNNVILK